jgi:hypothetical protein
MLQQTFTRFSSYVVNDIKTRNYAIADNFLGGSFLCSKSMMDRSEYSRCRFPNEPETDDEWSLFLTSWLFGLFPRVSLIRGKARYKLKLSRFEHRGLAEIYRAVFQDIKTAEKERKRQYKIAQETAYLLEGPALLLGNR